jgi:hypothetical protein
MLVKINGDIFNYTNIRSIIQDCDDADTLVFFLHDCDGPLTVPTPRNELLMVLADQIDERAPAEAAALRSMVRTIDGWVPTHRAEDGKLYRRICVGKHPFGGSFFVAYEDRSGSKFSMNIENFEKQYVYVTNDRPIITLPAWSPTHRSKTKDERNVRVICVTQSNVGSCTFFDHQGGLPLMLTTEIFNERFDEILEK